MEVIDILQEMLKDTVAWSDRIPDGIRTIIKRDTWQVRDPAPGMLKVREYSYFPKFVEDNRPFGLGVDYKTLEKICEDDAETCLLLAKMKMKKGGWKAKGENLDCYNVTSKTESVTGNSKQYGLKQLEKKRPDLYKQVASNQISVNAACIKAGLRKKTFTVTVTDDMMKLRKQLLKHFTVEQLQECINSEVLK